MGIEFRLVSSLEKVFLDEELRAAPFAAANAGQGEVFAFQIAACLRGESGHRMQKQLRVTAAAGALPVELFDVESVPVRVARLRNDPYMLRTAPGLYPDCLRPLDGGNWRLIEGVWQALWVRVRIPADCRPGAYQLEFTFADIGLDRRGVVEPQPVTVAFALEVLPFRLEAQRLLRYEWFHTDCLATYYRTECWSEEHWRIVENFIRNAAGHGVNVLLTPLWSIPLDTAVGGERPTAQLLDIRRTGKKYSFDFTRLERYLELGRRHGITHFAMSHAFTQWGAEATPKIMVEVDGRMEQLFGWQVPSDAPEYADFLRQLMPELLALFRKLKIDKNVFFSVSDEPRIEQIATYGKAAKLLKSVIGDLPTLDALSDFGFYQKGLVERPVASNNHIEPFVGQVPELWTYYCVSQEDLVPNRFMAMPSARNRVMGVMLYVYNCVGFLQWGYNFYYSQYSLEAVDPYRDVNAGRWVPAGDAFIVYPGADGTAHDSLRGEVFFEGLQDLRALRTLEAKIGREAVLALLHEGLDYPLKMTDYPRSADWLLQLRARVNRRLAERT